MINKTILFFAFLLLLNACERKSTHLSAETDIPKPLQEGKSFELDAISKSRSSDNIVEELYNDILERDTALYQLNQSILEVKTSYEDSTNEFNKFNAKNQEYYISINAYKENIKNEALKLKIKEWIKLHESTYTNKVKRHQELIHSIENKNIALNDLYFCLKMVKSLEVMDKYQNHNLPNEKTLSKYNRMQEDIINKIKSTTKIDVP